MMIGVKGKQLCDRTILPNQTSPDGRIDRWGDSSILAYPPYFVAGGITRQSMFVKHMPSLWVYVIEATKL